MIEWLLILTMASLGIIAFAILFKATPLDVSDLENEKVRQDLAKMAKKEEQKKKEEKQQKKADKPEKKQRQKEDEKKKGKANKSPPKEREAVIEDEDEQEAQTETGREIYVPCVPIQNNTPVVKVKRDNRSRSPVQMEEKPVKKDVIMPNKKQIDRDMQQGFVVVQKKGLPPLTPEQRKEREAMRVKEEEEEKRREAETLAREKEREKRRAELSLGNEVSFEDVKAKLDKQKLERQSKEDERKRVNCVVKEYSKVQPDIEETEKRSWGAATVPEGEEVPTVDAEDYPRLQPTD